MLKRICHLVGNPWFLFGPPYQKDGWGKGRVHWLEGDVLEGLLVERLLGHCRIGGKTHTTNFACAWSISESNISPKITLIIYSMLYGHNTPFLLTGTTITTVDSPCIDIIALATWISLCQVMYPKL
jgi:hypothetical protein